MPNPLQIGAPTPEAPMPNAGAATPSPMPQGGPQGPQGEAQQQAPAISHEQTVAALRHFHAIQDELEELLAKPEVGKSSVKAAIIDGATKLVSRRILTPAQAVQQLGGVPDNPLEQRKWLREQLASSVIAQNAVLEHHRASNQGTGDFATETIPDLKPDDHIGTMAGVLDHYKGLNRG